MALIAELCIEHDVWAITDEIYEHIVYAGQSPRDRDVARHARAHDHDLGTVEDVQLHRLAPRLRASRRERESVAIRKVHDFLTVGAPAPLQAAAAVGFAFDAEYYNHLALDYRARRELLCGALDAKRASSSRVPEGAYYIFADFSRPERQDDDATSRSG